MIATLSLLIWTIYCKFVLPVLTLRGYNPMFVYKVQIIELPIIHKLCVCCIYMYEGQLCFRYKYTHTHNLHFIILYILYNFLTLSPRHTSFSQMPYADSAAPSIRTVRPESYTVCRQVNTSYSTYKRRAESVASRSDHADAQADQ